MERRWTEDTSNENCADVRYVYLSPCTYVPMTIDWISDGKRQILLTLAVTWRMICAAISISSSFSRFLNRVYHFSWSEEPGNREWNRDIETTDLVRTHHLPQRRPQNEPQRSLQNTVLHRDTRDLSQTNRQVERTTGNCRIFLPRGSSEENKDSGHGNTATETG